MVWYSPVFCCCCCLPRCCCCRPLCGVLLLPSVPGLAALLLLLFHHLPVVVVLYCIVYVWTWCCTLQRSIPACWWPEKPHPILHWTIVVCVVHLFIYCIDLPVGPWPTPTPPVFHGPLPRRATVFPAAPALRAFPPAAAAPAVGPVVLLRRFAAAAVLTDDVPRACRQRVPAGTCLRVGCCCWRLFHHLLPPLLAGRCLPLPPAHLGCCSRVPPRCWKASWLFHLRPPHPPCRHVFHPISIVLAGVSCVVYPTLLCIPSPAVPACRTRAAADIRTTWYSRPFLCVPVLIWRCRAGIC